MAESNKMKDMPVNKLMIQMGIPMILSMALQAIYNIVVYMRDSRREFFISAMSSEAAVNALTLVFPESMLLISGIWNQALDGRYGITGYFETFETAYYHFATGCEFFLYLFEHGQMGVFTCIWSATFPITAIISLLCRICVS